MQNAETVGWKLSQMQERLKKHLEDCRDATKSETDIAAASGSPRFSWRYIG